jgi:hypothetical protein
MTIQNTTNHHLQLPLVEEITYTIAINKE